MTGNASPRLESFHDQLRCQKKIWLQRGSQWWMNVTREMELNYIQHQKVDCFHVLRPSSFHFKVLAIYSRGRHLFRLGLSSSLGILYNKQYWFTYTR